ncbi:hypothetical protein L9G15_12495 [Shewanella sp. A3A]|nr:hypothetical protein [Shewanella ferrihydritica]
MNKIVSFGLVFLSASAMADNTESLSSNVGYQVTSSQCGLTSAPTVTAPASISWNELITAGKSKTGTLAITVNDCPIGLASTISIIAADDNLNVTFTDSTETTFSDNHYNYTFTASTTAPSLTRSINYAVKPSFAEADISMEIYKELATNGTLTIPLTISYTYE